MGPASAHNRGAASAEQQGEEHSEPTLPGAETRARVGHPLLRWLAAVALAAAALGLTLLLLPAIEPAIFIFFFAAVACSAWYGGFGPGLVTTVLSAWSVHQFIQPPGLLSEHHVDDLIRLALFLGVAALLSSLSSRVRRTADSYHALVRASPLAIVTLSPQGCVTAWNGAAERLFGWRASEAVGQRMPTVPPAKDAEFRGLMDRVLAGEVISGAEVTRQRRDGSPIEVSVWAAPLHDAQGRVTGVLSVLDDITERKRAREAVEAARRQAEEAYAREHRIAARFQSALQPVGRICVPGYAIAHTYRPALVEADVGGDFYNIFDLGDRFVALVIGDVGGKGLDAAVVAFRVQQSALALLGTRPLEPETVLAGVRQTFLSFAEGESLVTLLLVVLDRETGRVCYANAGHEPPLLRRADAGVELLEAHGPAIHSLSTAPYPIGESKLAPGDVLLLYTDGLPDARPHGRDTLGTDRLTEVVAACADPEPEGLMASLYQAAGAHSGGDLRDDIAMVGIRRLVDAEECRYVFVPPPLAAGAHAPETDATRS